MINLIPNEEKKIMRRDFYFRAATIFLLALGLTMLIACVTLLPTYFLSIEKEKQINQKLDIQNQNKIKIEDQQVFINVSSIDEKLSLFEKTEKNHFLVSERVINQILLKKVKDIKITQISYKNSEKDGHMVNLSGIAPNREKLLLFRQVLEDNPSFKKVNLPISNFIKGSNIQFSLSLISL